MTARWAYLDTRKVETLGLEPHLAIKLDLENTRNL